MCNFYAARQGGYRAAREGKRQNERKGEEKMRLRKKNGGQTGDAVCGTCDLCGGELRYGQRYYRISGENVCRECLGDFAAQILAAYQVIGGEEDA